MMNIVNCLVWLVFWGACDGIGYLMYGPKLDQYVMSLFHAVIETMFGYWSFMDLHEKSSQDKYNCADGNNRYVTQLFTEGFVMYLWLDMALSMFKKRFKMSEIIHHLCFSGMAVVQIVYLKSCYVYAWLILGELSTIFLNIRTINRSIIADLLFVSTFFVTRIVLYGYGLFHFFQENPDWPFLWAVFTVPAIFCGYLLNIFWFTFIAKKVYSKLTEKPDLLEKPEYPPLS